MPTQTTDLDSDLLTPEEREQDDGWRYALERHVRRAVETYGAEAKAVVLRELVAIEVEGA